MARKVPETGAAGLCVVGRVGPPGGELTVGDHLAGNGDDGERRAGPREPRDRAVIDRDERERERKHGDEPCLRLEEDEEAALLVRGPAASQLLVAPVLGLADEAIDDEIRTEAETPHSGEQS